MPVVEAQQVDRPRVTRLAAKLAGPAILLVMITGILVIFNAIEPRGTVQSLAGLVEGLWELSLSIYCIVKGFRSSSPSSTTWSP